jgi:ABC-type antimicrobial peptide transport system permease subunit
MAILGVGIGGVVSLIASQLVAGMLFGVEPWDPVSFATIAGVLALTAIVAAAAPAVRAARVDPMVALRAE